MRVPVLSVQALSARHGNQEVLQGVSLSVHAGQWLAVVGPNGAGKSTLLRCLAGLMPLSAGQIHGSLADERAHPHLNRREPPPPRLSWLGQDVVLDEAMSVRDTVALGRLPHQGWWSWRGPAEQDALAIDQALQDTDMSWAAHRPLRALSGGERQRVRLARALAVQAPVLLLDEPVAHLDAPHQRLVAQVLRREASRGRAVVSVLHEIPLALAADRLAVMQSGRLHHVGERGDAHTHRAIEHVFDQALSILHVNDDWVVVPQFQR
jgi:iron complex transport system ATP-binding protein